MAAAPSANDLTRQQLDELDALLQRMLALPLTPAETPRPVSLAQAPTMRLTTTQVPVVDPPRPAAFEPPPIPAPEPTTPIIERKVVAPSTQIRAMPFPPQPRPTPVVPPLADEIPDEEPTREPVMFLLWPLVALNWVVDSILGLFGPPGWILRSGFGKNVLGVAGVGLLLYTAAHVGIQQGWFTLPFPVPWPK